MYEKQTWANLPDRSTPVNATRLSHLETQADEVLAEISSAGLVMVERVAPDAPAANAAHLFVRDNGSGKTQLCVRFASGAIQVVSTQP